MGYRLGSYIDSGLRELVRRQVAGTGSARRRGHKPVQRASEIPPPPLPVTSTTTITVKAGRWKLRRLRKRGWVPVDQLPGPPQPLPEDTAMQERAARVRAERAARRSSWRDNLRSGDEPF